MAVSVKSVEQVVNLALERIGYPKRIGSIYEGSLAAREALTIYAETRDQLLRLINPDFARKTEALALSGQAAPVPWLYSYVYPVDCIKIRDLIIANFDPLNPYPSRFTVATDTVAGKVILSAYPFQTIVYTSMLT